MIATATTIALALLGAAASLCVLRIVRGGSLADRVVALDAMLVVVVSGIVVGAARTSTIAFIDVAIIASLVGFIGSITVARFIERRGA